MNKHLPRHKYFRPIDKRRDSSSTGGHIKFLMQSQLLRSSLVHFKNGRFVQAKQDRLRKLILANTFWQGRFLPITTTIECRQMGVWDE